MEPALIRNFGKIETSMALNHQLLAGNTQGCQMVKVSCNLFLGQIRNAAKILFDQYGALRTSLQYTDEGFGFYSMSDFSKIKIDVYPMKSEQTWLEMLEKEVNDIINPEQAMWRLAAYVNADKNVSYLVACFHHSIVDGSGVIVFLNRLLQIIDEMLQGKAVNIDGSAKPFPPAIDQYLKKKDFNHMAQKESVNADRIHYNSENRDLSARQTRMEVLSLKGDDFLTFADSCKKKRMSVNGILASILVKACHQEKLFNKVVELKSAVSLRDRSPNATDETHALGCYITVANSVFSLEEQSSVEALCKSYDTQLFSAMLKEIAFINPASNKDMETAISSIGKLDYYAQGIGITNAGIIETNEYEHFKVLDWQTINNRCGGNVCIVLHAIQVKSQLNLGFVYSTPLISKEKVDQVAQVYQQEMDSFIRAVHEET